MSKNARWTVEIVEGYQAIRLQSCYSKYLTASSTTFLLGMTGKKVIQTTPPRLDTSVEWEPIREGVQVRLKTRHGQYLRANGGVPPWRNHVTWSLRLGRIGTGKRGQPCELLPSPAWSCSSNRRSPLQFPLPYRNGLISEHYVPPIFV
ncbi:unnamed protein product [Linum tenue]|uniref:DUF569 domain-containing protein n=1 Tax=Linum tenue TaxID=586396 RepID=A0AAV0L9W0_9ROSI|nr:unnamed protein product [Linum tenue]